MMGRGREIGHGQRALPKNRPSKFGTPAFNGRKHPDDVTHGMSRFATNLLILATGHETIDLFLSKLRMDHGPRREYLDHRVEG